jgi:hypothetical protein
MLTQTVQPPDDHTQPDDLRSCAEDSDDFHDYSASTLFSSDIAT